MKIHVSKEYKDVDYGCIHCKQDSCHGCLCFRCNFENKECFDNGKCKKHGNKIEIIVLNN